jgi:L-ribulose-5-phosphate 3-epimerase
LTGTAAFTNFTVENVVIMKRREFLSSSLIAGSGLVLAANGHLLADKLFSINIFSKNLQWLDYERMAQAAAEIGFEGIDLTVRPNGHVKPERVVEDLPRAVEAVRNAGLQVPMITTAVLSADEAHTENILKTASKLGISSYRMGWIQYDQKLGIEDNLKKFEGEFKKLQALNKKYNIRGEYQNHSGAYLGSAVWDIAPILKKLSPASMGLQYDILHATVEGANAWPVALKLVAPYVASMPIKDFQWITKEGKSTMELVPLGMGTVDFRKYFGMLKELSIQGPFSMHFEYPLGGVENGTTRLTIPEADVLNAMKKDLEKLRGMLKDAGIRD